MIIYYCNYSKKNNKTLVQARNAVYYGDAEGQRHIYLSTIYSVGEHYLYWDAQYENVSKYTLLNECNVTPHEQYNLTTESFLFFFYLRC